MNSSPPSQTADNSNPNSLISSSVTRLNLAPKLKRPLQLWNPLDYLRLLYWIFFFPQAIRWYLDTFANPTRKTKYRVDVQMDLLGDSVQRHLTLQVTIILLVTTLIVAGLLQQVGLSINWFAIPFGMVVGISYIMVVGGRVGVEAGLSFGVRFGMLAALSLMIGIGVGLACGIWFSLGIGGVVVSILTGSDLILYLIYGPIAGVIITVIVSYLFEWGTALLRAFLWRFFEGGGRLLLIPLPGLQAELVDQLETNWEVGVYNLNQFLAFTLQYIPVIGAVNISLDRTPPIDLLPRITRLAEQPWDWNLLQFSSASWQHEIQSEFIRGLFILGPLRRRWQARYPTGPRLDTPARAACAGFWFWHIEDTIQAIAAFEKVKELPHGPELYGLAQAIQIGQTIRDLPTVATWSEQTNWLDSLPHPELRSGSLAALRTLRTVAEQARLLQQAQAPLTRSLAANKANALLTHLLENGAATCPEPEWSLIQAIAEQWRTLFSLGGGVLSEELLRQPTLNPYEGYSGLPVKGSAFVGRSRIIAEIETMWASSPAAPPLVLFGHRRMGKSSIVRNLDNSLPTESLLVYLDMQDSGFVEHTGELLIDLAQALHRRAGQAGLNLGLAPAQADYPSLGPARQALNALLERLDAILPAGQRFIVAIDEFEVIQDGIDAGRIEADVLKYLRAINQKYTWLNLIFAGLHRLDELGRDYKSIFYGQAEHVRVGYLGYEDAHRLITQPHPDFSLEYEPALVEELYHLTYGQPYLLQRLCWELVNHWNERFLTQGDSLPRLLTLTGLEPVLTPDFYHGAGYYFDGVWGNITVGEQTLLRTMAPYPDRRRWTTAALATATGLDPATTAQAVDLLDRHDVVVREGDTIRFASELMRRWIVDIQPRERDNEEKSLPD